MKIGRPIKHTVLLENGPDEPELTHLDLNEDVDFMFSLLRKDEPRVAIDLFLGKQSRLLQIQLFERILTDLTA